MNALLKGLVLLGVLAGISYGGYHLFFAKTNAQACDKLAELCGGEAKKSALKRCTSFFGRLENAGGKENIARARTCILESRTCPAAVGCMVGAGLNAAGDFLEGIKRSLSDKSR